MLCRGVQHGCMSLTANKVFYLHNAAWDREVLASFYRWAVKGFIEDTQELCCRAWSQPRPPNSLLIASLAPDCSAICFALFCDCAHRTGPHSDCLGFAASGDALKRILLFIITHGENKEVSLPDVSSVVGC